MDTIQKENNKKALTRFMIFFVILAFLGIVYFFYYTLQIKPFEETEDAYVNAHQNIVTSQTIGNILEIHIDDTQHVKKGALAVKLDNTDYNIALEKAKNNLVQTLRNIKSVKLNKNVSAENLQLKLSDYKKAKVDFTRDENALKMGVLSREQFENTQHKLEDAKIAVEIAKTNLENSSVALTPKINDNVEVSVAVTQYKEAYINAKKNDILIPTDGVIARKSVHIGQRVSPNEQLFTVVDTDKEWVDANFKESQLHDLQPGQPVELTSDVNHKIYKGYIAGFGAGSGSSLSLLPAQNASGNWIKVVQRVPIKINIEPESLKENGILPIGTSMSVKVVLGKLTDVKESNSESISYVNYDNEINVEVNSIIKKYAK